MNSAVYLMPLYFNIDCDKAIVTISDGAQNHSFCGGKHPPSYQLYSGNGQLKISLVALKGNLEGQNFGFEFFTENLGILVFIYCIVSSVPTDCKKPFIKYNTRTKAETAQDFKYS